MTQQKVFSVSQFVDAISAYLEQGLGMVAVQGEISGFNVSKDRFVFFDLKDKRSRFSCFMMKWDLKVPLEDGMEVKIIGTPKLFQQSGKFHVRVMEVELVGAGALQRAFEMLKAKLEKEGLFAPERKRALPRFPQHIGIVTSEGAAAFTDVVRILNNRWSGLQITLAHVGVQGAGAIGEIAGAIRWFNLLKSDFDILRPEPSPTRRGKGEVMRRPDVLIVTRGGGSMEELQAFNSEEVARAIFASEIPVIVGVGHERDVTLADFVADVRAATPSNAAERAVPDRQAIVWQIDSMSATMESALRRMSGDVQHRAMLALQEVERRVQMMMDAPRQLTQRFTECFYSFQTNLATLRERVIKYAHLIEVLSLTATLARGYSISMVGGRVVTSVRGVKRGDEMTTKLRDGRIQSVVC